MASVQREDLLCPVCQNIFENPVTLTCEHSFCVSCLKTNWAERETTECPVCKRRSSKTIPVPDFSLKMASDEVRASGFELLCSLHAETLSLFCVDEQQLLCRVCRESETHSEHKLQLTEEAGQQAKKTLQDSLKPLRKRMRLIREVKGSCDQTAGHIKTQAEATERKIKEQFKRLHQFLEEEEEARLNALREEEEQKSHMMAEKIRALNKEISDLSGLIKTTENELRAKDVQFLLNYKETVERIQQQPVPDDPDLISGALIDEARYLGNLSFNVWSKMKDMISFSPVVLDPNTAHPDLTLSDDLTSLKQATGKQELPDNPERIDRFISVIGSESFTSGCHSWEVEVGENDAYVLGVLVGSDVRKGVIWPGLWRLMFCKGEYKTLSPTDLGSDVSVKGNPRRIRLFLDYDGGRLLFSDAETGAHIHTFTHTFTDRLFPYISTWSEVPIKIAPQKITAAVEEHL
ncbi:zinc-binding protein A33-like [Poecilia latipinna]|uniref:zinc-binding protein A33-like n=1 Tax=Poecilia latipinna TaxID=48699 RepID=UPI00072ECBB8|nr:PREDICTED: zinc-binding protein A33-like [Poecilia latipinna]